MRSSTRHLLKLGTAQLKSRGFHFSEQRLMKECLRFALKFWRGRKGKSTRNRKYNKRIGPYEIMPFYTSEALRAVAWARCHQAGISLSRIMDFAVRVYLPRVIESWCCLAYREEDRVDAQAWQDLYAKRLNRTAFVISYQSKTSKNDQNRLRYEEMTEIHPWPPPKSGFL